MNAVIAVMPSHAEADADQIAVRIGRPAATSEPKVSTSTSERDARCRSARRRRRAAPSTACRSRWPRRSGRLSRASASASLTASCDGGLHVGDGVDVEVPDDGADPAVLGERQQRPGVGLGLGLRACRPRPRPRPWRRAAAVRRRPGWPARARSGTCGGRRRGRRSARRPPSEYAGSSSGVPLGCGDDDGHAGLVEGVDRARGRARPAGRRPSPRGCPGSRRRRSSAWTWWRRRLPTPTMATSQAARKSGQRR